MQNKSEFYNHCLQIVQHFSEALFSEKITSNHLQSSANAETTYFSNFLCEGILDLSFIRDIQLTAAQLMNQKILKEVNFLDTQVLKVNELKCAKLMTLLKPYYLKANIILPVVPTPPSINSYPLVLSRDSIKEPSLEICRLYLLKARKNYRNFVNNELKGGPVSAALVSTTYSTHEFQVSFLIKDLIQQFTEWAQEELLLRMQRKQNSVDDRLEQLKQFKIQLILTLHNRFVENGVNSTNSVSQNSQSSSFWSFGWSASATPSIIRTSDFQLHVSLKDKFSFLDVDEPIIVESQGTAFQISPQFSNNLSSSNFLTRKGSFYFTLGNIMYYSASTFSYNPFILVIPMKIVTKMELWKEDKVIFSQSYKKDDFPQSQALETKETVIDKVIVSDSKPLVLPLSALSGSVAVVQPNVPSVDQDVLTFDEAIVVTDISGQRTVLKFSEVTPDYNFRVYDLLDLLLKVLFEIPD
jgi:hypothetical protein